MKEMVISAENNALNAMVMVYLATTLSEDKYKQLRITFIEIDTDKNGTICIHELQKFFLENDDPKEN